MIHYPPKFSDGRETEFVPRLEAAGVQHCIYGHLHGKDLAFGFVGEQGGVHYHLTSCDHLDFTPIELTPW
jgi:predicted phosphohydrolase